MAKTLAIEEQQAVERVVLKFNLNKKWLKEGEVMSFLRILSKKFGSLSESFIEKVHSINDMQVIETIIDSISEINSLEEVVEYLNN